ncbi:MAG: sensor histidine kinase [Acidimicrobiia bacterium]
MKGPKSDRVRRPSSWWVVLAAICAALTAAAAIAAIAVQRESAAPIGEGEVFVADVEAVAGTISASSDAGPAVRRARNELGIEAVSVLDEDGVVVASTSDPLVGEPVSNPLIAFGAADRRFMALATAIEEDLWLDEVVSQTAGTVLYQVVSPLEGGGSVLLHYDVTELISRRASPGGIQPLSIQLLGLAAIFGVLGIAVLIGHSRAARRYRKVALESETLRTNSIELTRANASLEQARHQAEEALALAEEKIRIRSEFVLMINHELRTPLTSVVTGAELLRSRNLSAADRSALLDAMVADGSRLQEIIDQILAVARIENRGLSYELTEVPFEEVCQALASAHSAARTAADPDSGAEVSVKTDIGALCLVVGSLVDNAFTHGAHQVSIGCERSARVNPQLVVGDDPESAIYVTVADDGPGIDHEFLPRIFEKFEKSSFSSGTGLGLYMARMIVEALDGSLSVETSPAGTTIQISIPAMPARDRVEAVT